jgi:hypothetical protein
MQPSSNLAPPTNLYLDSRLAALQERLANTEVDRFIENAYSTIQTRIKNKRERKATRNYLRGEMKE